MFNGVFSFLSFNPSSSTMSSSNNCNVCCTYLVIEYNTHIGWCLWQVATHWHTLSIDQELCKIPFDLAANFNIDTLRILFTFLHQHQIVDLSRRCIMEELLDHSHLSWRTNQMWNCI